MDTWWIDKPRLLGSRNPTDADLEQLRGDGFEVLVSLLKEEEQPPRYDVDRAVGLGFARHNIPVKDFCPPTVDQLEQFVSLIADLPPETKTVVHCEGGTGRTGTFAAAYWVAEGLTVSDAITRVREARPHAVETPEQEATLRDFASRWRGRGGVIEKEHKPGLLERAMEFVLTIDREKEQAYIKKLKERRPHEKPTGLADQLIQRAKWWAAGWGFMTGVPANPWVVVPAAITDAGAMLRTEIKLAVRIALLYDPQFLDDDEPPYELLVPIFGIRAGAEFLREMSVRGAMGVTRATIRKYLSKETLKAFKRVMLKYFGLKVTQRGVIKGTLPVVGGGVGGTWNYREMGAVGGRVKQYFEGTQLDDPEGAS